MRHALLFPEVFVDAEQARAKTKPVVLKLSAHGSPVESLNKKNRYNSCNARVVYLKGPRRHVYDKTQSQYSVSRNNSVTLAIDGVAMNDTPQEDTSEHVADRNGWSLVKAEGYLHGVTLRQSGKLPSSYLQVGIDEYCRGFRAGYYERHDNGSSNKPSAPDIAAEPVVRLTPHASNEAITVVDATIVSDLGG